MEHKGLALTRSQILDAVWGRDCAVFERIVDTYIKNLRRKLREAGAGDCIEAVWGIGFRLRDPEEDR